MSTAFDIMPKSSEKVLFLSSPGGMAEERDIVVKEVRRLNAGAARDVSPKVRIVKWPDDIAAGAGHYLQSVINQQIGIYDIFVGLVGSRIGTPTPRANSGTEEEFDRAIAALRNGRRLEILLFFSNRPVPIGEIDPHQLLLVHYFRQKIERLGVLAHSYSDLDHFKRLLRKSLEPAYWNACHTPAVAQLPAVSALAMAAAETVVLEDVSLRTCSSNPQGAVYYVVPLAAARNGRIIVTGIFRSASPYFRFGFKFGDAREPILSAGSIQTFGHNILVHLGKNSAAESWFLTCYQSGMRLGQNSPLPSCDADGSVAFSFEFDTGGQIAVRLNGKTVLERFFVVDEMPRLVLMAWADEYECECEVTDLRMALCQ